jgi:molybdopterin converting factor small subunit
VIVRLLLFAGAREAAGCGRAEFELDAGSALDRLLADAVARYGDRFADVLGTARVWINGDEPAGGSATELRDDDEVAILPPVSGGAE